MKRLPMVVLAFMSILLSGCQANSQLPPSEPPHTENLLQIETTAEEGCLEPIPSDALSQDVYDALREEWERWNALSEESRVLSSHSPGLCRRSFDDWAACEDFLGISISNPLEECSWLEKATYVAMPIGFRGAPRIEAGWYGTEDGHVEWVSVQAGYRKDWIRVMIAAVLYGDSADTKPADRGWSVELERRNYLADTDGASLLVTSDRTERYFSNTAYQAYGNVLYRFNIVGGPDEQTQVEDTLKQVMDVFPMGRGAEGSAP